MDDRYTDPGPEAPLDDWLRFTSDGSLEKPRPRWDAMAWLAVALAAVTVVGMVMLWPTGGTGSNADSLSGLGVPSELYEATVIRAEVVPCVWASTAECLFVDFELHTGPDVGFVYSQEFYPGPTVPSFAVGQQVVLSYFPTNASIQAMADQPCSFDVEQICRILTLVIDDRPEVSPVDHELFPGDSDSSYFVGAKVMVDFIEGDAGEIEIFGVAPEFRDSQYAFADFQRRPVLAWLALIFAAVVIWLGRWRGAAALGGLVASVAILLLFILPAILEGQSPVLVAVFGSAGIAFIALYLAHGFNRMTTVALVGTVATLILTAGLSSAAVGLAAFTGLASEESSMLTLFNGVDVRGLLLAGIVLGAAGAIDDVTVTQASAVWELRAANPELPASELLRRGLRIGRDHIASMVNTLLLAYVGASLPLMVLFVLSEQSLGTVANSEVVAVEIVRTLVGSIGLVAAVPLTTWLAAISKDPTVPVRRPLPDGDEPGEDRS